MKTEIIRIDPNNIQSQDLEYSCELLRSGQIVAFPTETVYGLGANALDSSASSSIFQAKGRPQDNPLIVHVADPCDIALYSDISHQPLLEEIMNRFMPGPITVILPKKKIIPDSVTAGLNSVAIRCPSHPIARALISLSGIPMAAPSANLSGKPSPTRAAHVIDDFNEKIPMIIDGGDCVVGLESTVIRLMGRHIDLLRPGFVSLEDLLPLTDDISVSKAVLSPIDEDEKPESPGMKYRHYAPSASVTMVKGSDADVIRLFQEKAKEKCGILCFDEDLAHLSGDYIISLGRKNDLNAQAHSLFSALREFDALPISHIYARFTNQENIGLAVTNRLLRASAFHIITI